MAERDQIAGSLGRHDAGQASDLEHVSLGKLAVPDQGQGLGLHPDEAAGGGRSESLRFLRNVDHATGPRLVEVSQAGH